MEVDILHFSLLLTLLASVTQGVEELSQRVCDDHTMKCYYLYRESTRITFADAWTQCSKKAHKLAPIEDAKTQSIISRFNHKNMEELVRPWLAGKRSSDDTWRTTTGNVFPGLNYELATDYKCAVFTAEANNKNNYYANACKIIEHQSIPLRLPACELAPVNGNCPTGSELVAGNICYAIPRNWTRTAFDANTICNTHYPGSTLAHTNIRDSGFTDFVRRNFEVNELADVWIGVYRKPWVWLPDGASGQEVIFTFTNWRKFSGVGSGDRHCLVIDIKNDYTWLDVSCTEPIYYFLCQGDQEITTESYTVEENIATTAASTTKKSPVLSDTIIIIIACAVGGVLLFIILILIIVICARRKRRRRAARTTAHAVGGGRDYNADSYQRNISRVPNRQPSNGTTTDFDRGSTNSVGVPKSSTDATNRELTPMDFNLMWGNVKDKRDSKRQAQPSPPTTPDILPDSRSNKASGLRYSNDGFLYENIDN